ncbi:MAG: prephenate dehydrogenase [Candidatus Atribacteria bacterium]|nr:prephenate dehydrogenase [Candidatus Atribacteria bacterium]MCD6350279.1 prephenate dehydrogenase [Candidatus Atribacteria bacterium]
MVSHLPHLIANAYLWGILEERKKVYPLAGPYFKDFMRVAGSNPEVWADIFWTNREEILKKAQRFKECFMELCEILESNNIQRLLGFLKTLEDGRKEL